MLFYSQSTRGFYDSEIHGDAVPSDAVEISTEEHTALLAAQSAGKAIVPDSLGMPIAVERAPAGPPASVKMRQARLALLQAGHYATVEEALARLPGDAGAAARIEWEFAETVERASPIVALLSSEIGLTEEALDQLFFAAVAL